MNKKKQTVFLHLMKKTQKFIITVGILQSSDKAMFNKKNNTYFSKIFLLLCNNQTRIMGQ